MQNAGIILQGQGVQPVNALAQGAMAGQQMNDIRRTNEMRAMMQQNGAGILAGDQNALNALAGFDPQAAQALVTGRLNQDATRLNMQATQQSMQLRAEEMQMRLRSEAREIEAAAAQATAAERAALAEQIKQSVAMGLQAQTPEQWDAIMQQRNPDYVGMFEQREMLAAEYMSLADSLVRMDARNAPPTPLSAEGKFYTDQRNGFVPEGETMRSTGNTVNVNNGNPDAFQSQIDKASADMFIGLYENLPNAMSKAGQVENLATLLEAAPTGAGAVVKQWLGGVGIETEGLSDIQALQAAINRLVPEQRQPGSGPMSDADLALFIQSLPRLINTPEGNQKIVETMRGLAQYEASQARIAARVVSGELTRQKGQDALMNLPNPLAGFSGGGVATPSTGGDNTPGFMPAVGEIQDNHRFLGGDPGNPNSWMPLAQGGAGR